MKLKSWILLIILLLIFVALGYGWWWMQGDAEGVVRTGTTQEKLSQEPTGTSVYTGTYFTLDIPRAYQERSHTVPESGPVKETLFVVSGGESTDKIALTVEERVEKTLDASPGFKIRESDRAYHKINNKSDGSDIVIFTKTEGGFEKSLYFFQESFLVSISYTALASKDDIESVLLQMQKTFKIRSLEERQKATEKGG